uniref:Reverse transcriptase domain-containing protein n=1 Tax=Lygus hesperus TaxID=30085 RepID=A0A0K8SFG0_LYGHE
MTDQAGSKDTSYLSSIPPGVSHVGFLRFCVDAWASITENKNILQWIRGFHIPFSIRPSVPFVAGHTAKRSQGLDAHISELLSMGAISKVQASGDQFVSPIFLVPKPGGKSRFILNLKVLNNYVTAPHFKMDDHRTLMRILPSKFFGVTLDLQDAYYAVSIAPEDRNFLCFDYDACRYSFNCLCFGLACAPYTFSKLIRPVVAALRQRNILCLNYLDDFCFLGQSPSECSEAANQAISLLDSLGFKINFKKSVLQPSCVFRFLGFQFNSITQNISLPMDKIVKLKSAINKFLGVRSPTIRQAAKVIGLLISAVPAVPYSLIHCRHLEHDRYCALMASNNNFKAHFSLSEEARNDIHWWLKALESPTNRFPLRFL